jgi:hypothetical protein
MGWGDELMAAGHAKRIAGEMSRRVAILDAHGRPRDHELWQGLEFISRSLGPGIASVRNGPGCRPYIRYPFTSAGHGYTGWRAREHRPILSRALVARADAVAGQVLIEPTLKSQANPNKRWRGWQDVVDALPDVEFVQCRPPGEVSLSLRGVRVVETATFLDAVRCLARVSLYLGAEGGMHHAAAALNVPAVVVFGGSPSIEATGYPDHVNFGTSDPCGRWEPCAHCAQIMNAITPQRVIQAVKDALQ